MRVLAITNMYPSAETPYAGVFIEQQIRGLRRAGVEVQVMVVDRLKEGAKTYWGLGRRVLRRLAAAPADVVHVMYGGVMANEVANCVQDRPLIVTFHGSDLLGENLSGRLRKWISAYGVQCSHKAAIKARGIVTVSKVLSDALPKNVDRSKIRIIPCGIDLERFKPLNHEECCQRLTWNPQHFHVLFPANTGDPVKRPALARAAVKFLVERGIAAELHYLSGVANTEVPIWMNASNALLLTSLHEGSPTVVKEALACNVPVVSVDVGDVRERIEGIQGCYLAAPDAVSLAEKLLLVKDQARIVDSRATIAGLSLERVAKSLCQFYSDVLD
ncbi:MAG: glycosyltransferase [Acidobacteria bacterium]|nr:glycosyltransferase [Acidobacteriota bacterium]MCI0717974.1 glycosyltransferase [Acidobacteriota bacterium]